MLTGHCPPEGIVVHGNWVHYLYVNWALSPRRYVVARNLQYYVNYFQGYKDGWTLKVKLTDTDIPLCHMPSIQVSSLCHTHFQSAIYFKSITISYFESLLIIVSSSCIYIYSGGNMESHWVRYSHLKTTWRQQFSTLIIHGLHVYQISGFASTYNFVIM